MQPGIGDPKFHTYDKTSANNDVFLNTLFLFGLIVLVIFFRIKIAFTKESKTIRVRK